MDVQKPQDRETLHSVVCEPAGPARSRRLRLLSLPRHVQRRQRSRRRRQLEHQSRGWFQHRSVLDLRCCRVLLWNHHQQARYSDRSLVRWDRLCYLHRFLPVLQPHGELRLHCLCRRVTWRLRWNLVVRSGRDHDVLPTRGLQRPLHLCVLDDFQPWRSHWEPGTFILQSKPVSVI